MCSCGSDRNGPPAPDSLDRAHWSASRAFTAGGTSYSPADFEEARLTYRFRPGEKLAHGKAEIAFRATTHGLAYFLSDPAITSARLDGEELEIVSRPDPDNFNTLRVIPRQLRRGTLHHLALKFVVPASRVTLDGGSVGFLTSMSDLGRGNYLEAYSPSSFEHDSFRLTTHLAIEGEHAPGHRVFTNGTVTRSGGSEWEVEFPGHFTPSSFYLHLTDTPFFVKEGSYAGLRGAIPLVAYSREEQLAAKAIEMLPALFAELEATYGAYAHPSFLAYIAGRGGMEYSGATISSLGALGHELTHSWFARGVMPSDGRSGWIDEAIASWRDFGYFRSAPSGRAPTNLARYSAFQRFTPGNSYSDGRQLLSEIDHLLASQGGLRPALADFFHEWKLRTVRTADLEAFLGRRSGPAMTDLFRRFVYAADSGWAGDGERSSREENPAHPELTERELRELR